MRKLLKISQKETCLGICGDETFDVVDGDDVVDVAASVAAARTAAAPVGEERINKYYNCNHCHTF